MSKVKSVPAAGFKARCLALLNHVARTRETIIVTKRGRAIAWITPVSLSPPSLRGSVSVHGDIVGSLLDDWQ